MDSELKSQCKQLVYCINLSSVQIRRCSRNSDNLWLKKWRKFVTFVWKCKILVPWSELAKISTFTWNAVVLWVNIDHKKNFGCWEPDRQPFYCIKPHLHITFLSKVIRVRRRFVFFDPPCIYFWYTNTRHFWKLYPIAKTPGWITQRLPEFRNSWENLPLPEILSRVTLPGVFIKPRVKFTHRSEFGPRIAMPSLVSSADFVLKISCFLLLTMFILCH
jgi:hypothetical protein